MVRKCFVIICAVLFAASCSSSGSSSKGTTPATTSGGTTSTTSGADPNIVWLCRPGQSPDPCTSDETTTVVAADGSKTIEHDKPATDPKVDCFYVYPTVSTQSTAVANLHIDKAETDVAVAQASRFSQVCHVFAPMYRQRTIAGIGGTKATAEEAAAGPKDVQTAWEDYLAHDNHGRGVILIGHSQGSFVLTSLIAKQIDAEPNVRKLVVSALLLGGNVMVPDGKDVGGSFKHIPVCGSKTQTGCVVAYSTFPSPPPKGSLFGSKGSGTHVVCVNPADPGGGSAPLHPYFPTTASLLGGIGLAKGAYSTPWVAFPDLFTGECQSNGNADWLQVTDVRNPGDSRPVLKETLGPTWGYHLYDVNIAYGDLVDLASSEAGAWKG